MAEKKLICCRTLKDLSDEWLDCLNDENYKYKWDMKEYWMEFEKSCQLRGISDNIISVMFFDPRDGHLLYIKPNLDASRKI